MQVIKSLEGGRGIAALIVALFHLRFGVEHAPLTSHGYLFVDLFFVLSGYVIYASYHQKLFSLADCQSFIIRRFGRLFPLLIFSTVAYVLAADSIVLIKRLMIANGFAGALHNPDALDYLIPHSLEILTTLTMTHGLNVFDSLILNTPSWSISTEFYTYVLFAAVCITLRGWPRLLAFALLSIIGLVISINASLHVYDCLHTDGCLSLTFDFGFPRTVFSFFLGALTCRFSHQTRFHPGMLQIVSLTLLITALVAVNTQPGIAFSFPFIFALLILSVHKDEGWLATILQGWPCQVLGQRSYSIYMLHMPLVLFFENVAKRIHSPILSALIVLVYTTVLITISGFTYRYIEDPFRTVFNRLAARRMQIRMRSVGS